MKYINNWDETKDKFISWWKGDLTEGPMMHIIAKGPNTKYKLIEAENDREHHLNIDLKVQNYINFCETHTFLGEAFPNLNVCLGPGSMATYLGSEPIFKKDTIWYEECIHDWDNWSGFIYDEDSYWWQQHKAMVKKTVELSEDRFLVNIPDIIENIDIISAMRGPQNTCFDLIDAPDILKKGIDQIDALYFKYYNEFYNSVKKEDGSCSYTGFKIWGPGKTAKVQCDFSALMSPTHFREFIIPSLKKQCQVLDYSLYHLDGPDAIRHVDALMELEKLNALQWTAGAGEVDGLNEKWYPIYDKVIGADKSLWILVNSEEASGRWETEMDKLLKRYGSKKIFFVFVDPMTKQQADHLLELRDKKWRKYK